MKLSLTSASARSMRLQRQPSQNPSAAKSAGIGAVGHDRRLAFALHGQPGGVEHGARCAAFASP